MKKYGRLASVILMWFLLGSAPAWAFQQLTGNGDIVINVKDELGNTVKGAKVTLTLPTTNDLGISPDAIVFATDGAGDEDLVTSDGDVEFKKATIGPYVSGGQVFNIEVEVAGYITWSSLATYTDAGVNLINSANSFTVKINIQDELGNALSGVTTAILGGFTIKDNGAGDGSQTPGLVYIAQNPSGLSTPANLTFTAQGYVTATDNTHTINSSFQTEYTVSMLFGFIITAQDEINQSISLDPADITLSGTGLHEVAKVASGGNIYWAATGTAPGGLTLSNTGYIKSTTYGAITYNSGMQQNIDFDGMSDGPTMQHSIVVLGVTDEMGNNQTFTGTPMSATGFTIKNQYIDTGTNYVYVAAAGSTGTLMVSVPGFISATATIAPSTTAQKTIDFDDGVVTELGATVDGPPVRWPVKVQGGAGYVERETGGGLTLDGSEFVDVCLDSACATTEMPANYIYNAASATWYIATMSTGTKYFRFKKSGYVSAISASYNVTGLDTISPTWTIIGGNPLKYTLKVVLTDELGASMDPTTFTTLTYNGSPYTAYLTNVLYFAGATGTAQTLSAIKAGWVNTQTTNGALQAFTLLDTAQTVIQMGEYTAAATGTILSGATNTVKGMEYEIHVRGGYSRLHNELNATLELDGTETFDLCNAGCGVTYTPQAIYWRAATALASATWYIAPDAAAEGANRYVRIYKVGYVRQADAGALAIDGYATVRYPDWAPSAGDGLTYQIKVVSGFPNIFDQMGNAVALNGSESFTICADPGCAVTEAASEMVWNATSTSWYIGPSASGTIRYIRISKPGYANTIDDGGITPTSAGPAVTPTWSGMDALQFLIRIKGGAGFAETETGAAITLNGTTEYFDICDDAACTTTETPTATYWDGGSSLYYITPASTGTKYVRFHKGGFVQTASEALGATGTAQVTPHWTVAGSNPIKYTLRVEVSDELGGTIDVSTLATFQFAGVNDIQDATALNVGYFAAATGSAGSLSVRKGGTYAYGETTNSGFANLPITETAQTVIEMGDYAPLVTGTAIAGVNNIATGLEYEIHIQGGAGYLADELGNALELDGTEQIDVCTTVGCAVVETPIATAWVAAKNKWFIAPAAAAEGASRYIRITKLGYVRKVDTTAIVPSGAVRYVTPSWQVADGDPLLFQIKVTSGAPNLMDQFAQAVTLSGGEVITVCTNVACTSSETPVAITWAPGSTAWYIAPAASGSVRYIRMEKPGFAAQVDTGGVIPTTAGPQVSPAWTTGGGDGLNYLIRVQGGVNYLYDELGNILSLTGVGEGVEVCTSADCAATETPSALRWSAGSWYIAPATFGAKYIRLTEPGYVRSVSDSISATGTTVVSPHWTASAGNPLKFTLKVISADELGTAIPIGSINTLTFNGSAPTYSVANAAYFANSATGTSHALVAQINSGWVWGQVTNTGYGNITLTDTGQTVVGMGPYTAAATSTIASGATNTVRGFEYEVHVVGGSNYLENELGASLTLDGTEYVELCSAACGATYTPQARVWDAANKIWYIAPDAAGEGGTRYIRITKLGYVRKVDAGGLAIRRQDVPTVPAWTNAGGDAIQYLATVAGGASLQDQFGNSIALNGEEGVTVCKDLACATTETPNELVWNDPTLKWYVGLPASGTARYFQITKPGYTTKIDIGGVTPAALGAGPQVTPAWTVAGADPLQYLVKVVGGVGFMQTELGLATATTGIEYVEVCTDSTCAGIETPSSLIWDGGSSAWYLAPATTGDKYIRVLKPGFVRAVSEAINASGSTQISPHWTILTGNPLKYTLKVELKNELGTPMPASAFNTLTYNNVAGVNSSTTIYFYGATGTHGFISRYSNGYVNGETTNGAFSDLTTTDSAQTVVQMGDNAAAATGTIIPGATTTVKGMEFEIHVTGGAGLTEDVLNNPLTLDGTENVEVCTASTCATTETPDAKQWSATHATWYIAPAAASEGQTTRRVRLTKTGYVRRVSSANLKTDRYAPFAQPTWTYAAGNGLQHQILIQGGSGYLEDTFGNAITLAGDESFTICKDVACVNTETPITTLWSATATQWFIAPPASATARFVKVTKPNFQPTVETAGVTPLSTAQVTPRWRRSDGDGLRPTGYSIRVLDWATTTSATVPYIQSETGKTINLDGSEGIEVCNDALCAVTETPSSLMFASGVVGAPSSWYVMPATPGTKYVRLTKQGYVTTISGALDATGTVQVNPTWLTSGGNSLKYTLKVVTANELGTPVAASSFSALTYNGVAAAATDTAGSFFAATSSHALSAQIAGGFINGETTNGAFSNITLSATSQTIIVMGDYTAAATDTIVAGTSNNARGLEYMIHVQGGAGYLENQLGNAIALAGSETIDLCTNAACTTTLGAMTDMKWSAAKSMWYIAPSTTTATYYPRILRRGFVRTVDSTSVTVNNSGAPIVPAWTNAGSDSLPYQVAVKSGSDILEDELNNGLILGGADAITLCTDASCVVTQTPDELVYSAPDTTWYMAPPSTGTRYVKMSKVGYVPKISPSITVDGLTQQTPVWKYDAGGNNGLRFAIRVQGGASYIQSEQSSSLTSATTDVVEVCLDAACGSIETAVAQYATAGAMVNSPGAGTYIAPASTGTKYIRITKVGYVSTISNTIDASGSVQISPKWLVANNNPLKYTLKLIAADELGNAVDISTGHTVTYGGTAATVRNYTAAYFAGAVGTPRALSVINTNGGYVNGETTNGGFSNILLVSSTQTVIIMGDYAAAATSTIVSGATNTVKGEEYEIHIAGGAGKLESEIGTAIALGGSTTESFDLCSDNVCTSILGPQANTYVAAKNMWFVAPPASAEGTSIYVRAVRSGYVAQMDGTSIAINKYKPSVSPAFTMGGTDGLKYQIALNSGAGNLEDELGTALNYNGNEEITVCPNTSCTTTETPDALVFSATSGTWYIAPPASASGSVRFIKLMKPGFISATETTGVTPTVNGPQKNPVFSGADGLKYFVRIYGGAGYLESETGAAIALSSSEFIEVCNDSACAVTEAPSSLIWNGSSWYIASASTGTKYFRMTKTGYVSSISNAVTASQSGQTSPRWTSANGNTLKYTLKVQLADELGATRQASSMGTFTYNGAPAAVTNAATAYFDGATGTAYALLIQPGNTTGLVYGEVTNAALNNLVLSSSTQTVIVLGDYTAATSTVTLTSGATNNIKGLEYIIHVAGGAGQLETEIGTPLALDGTETLKLCVAADCTGGGDPQTPIDKVWNATKKMWFLAPKNAALINTDNYVAISKTGYVFGTDATTIHVDQDAVPVSPGWTLAGNDGVKYPVMIVGNTNLTDTLANSLSLNGLESFAICTNSSCTATETPVALEWSPANTAWYAAVSTSGGARYFRIDKPGFVRQIDVNGITPSATLPKSPTWAGADALNYIIKVSGGSSYLQDELGNARTLDGTELLEVCNNADCSTLETPTAMLWSAPNWYIAPASLGAKYFRITKKGFVSAISRSITTTNTAQANQPTWLAPANPLAFTMKMTTLQDEGGNTLTPSRTATNNDFLLFYTTVGCNGAVATPEAGPYFATATNIWYAALATDTTYYAEYARNGYIKQCDSAAVNTVVTGPVSPSFRKIDADGIAYALRIELYNQYGGPVSGATLKHGVTPPLYSNQGTYKNEYYFNTTSAGQLSVIKTGYTDIPASALPADVNSVIPGSTSQTYIKVTGTSYSALKGTIPNPTDCTDHTCDKFNGLSLSSTPNFTLTVKDDNGYGITQLTSSNIHFYNTSGIEQTPTIFIEKDLISSPGVYLITVSTSATTYVVQNANYDGDAYTDMLDSVSQGITWVSSAASSTVTMYRAADHLVITAPSTNLSTTGQMTVAIGAYDNDSASTAGDIVGVGPDATRTVTFTLAGGSTTPRSAMNIVSSTLSNATVAAQGTNLLTVTGGLIGGAGTVTFEDTVYGDATPLRISVAPAAGTTSLPQSFASNTTSLTINILPATTNKVVLLPASDITADQAATISAQIQDVSGSRIINASNKFAIQLSGNAKIASIIKGTMDAMYLNTNSAIVEAASGDVIITVTDRTAETFAITLSDPEGTGLNVSSMLNVNVSPGAPKGISITLPATTFVGTTAQVVLQLKDANDNVITNNSAETIKATITNSATFSPSGLQTTTVTVQNGQAVVGITDNKAETVMLTVVDQIDTSISSAATMTFSPQNSSKLVFTVSTGQNLTAGVVSGNYIVEMRDYLNNTVTAAAPVTVTLSSSNPTGKFSATSGFTAETTTVTIPAGVSIAQFYYKDTKAGDVLLNAQASGMSQASLTETVKAAAPFDVSTGTVTFTTPAATVPDSAQPTGRTTYQTANDVVLIGYPTTESGTLEIPITSATPGKVTVYVSDRYGNVISSKNVTLSVVTGSTTIATSKLSVSGGTTSDSQGRASFTVSASQAGTAALVAYVEGYTYPFGKTFSIIFKSNDKTPPTVTRTKDLQDGDYIDSVSPIRFRVNITDTGTSGSAASGVDLSTISVTMTGPQGTVAGALSAANCTNAASCELSWTPTAAITVAGSYTLAMKVKDMSGNEQTHSWTLRRASSTSTAVENVLPGQSVYNPMTGTAGKITFQSPAAGAASIVIYSRGGDAIRTISGAITAGYNEMSWDGRDNTGEYVGNGIYLFRITTSTGSVATGKIAVFKR